MHMFLMGIFWYHLYDMSNYKLCNLDTYNHNFGSRMETFCLKEKNIMFQMNGLKNTLKLKRVIY